METNNYSNGQSSMMMSYSKFSLMMFVSFIIMYSVMFLNVDEANHIYLSITRTYMTLLMVSPMAVIMMLMMGKMYPNKKWNIIILISGVVIFCLCLAGLRTQTAIGDEQYMKAMIPHHSSAIMVSKHANIQDPEVKKLSEGIIASQKKEIAEMKAILYRMK
jgi:uncharacterized protein (DUF305 family)